MTKVTVIVENGFVTRILGNDPENTEVDVIDLDTNTNDAEAFSRFCLEKAEKELKVIY